MNPLPLPQLPGKLAFQTTTILLTVVVVYLVLCAAFAAGVVLGRRPVSM